MKKKLTFAGIACGQKFKRALLLDLYRTGDAFTHGSVVDDPALAVASQIELDFTDYWDPETAFPACEICGSVDDLHLTLTGKADALIAQLQCLDCRALPAARADTSIPRVAFPPIILPGFSDQVREAQARREAIRRIAPR